MDFLKVFFQCVLLPVVPALPIFIFILLDEIFMFPNILNFIFGLCYCIIYSYILWIATFEDKQKNVLENNSNTNQKRQSSNNVKSYPIKITCSSVLDMDKNIVKSRTRNLINERFNEITKNMNPDIIKNKELELVDYALSSIKADKKALEKIWQGTSIQDYDKLIDDYLVKEEKRLKNHLSYEGRISVKDKRILKEKLGYTCQSCGLKMSEKYGNIGSNYIELHHKIPYSQLKENDSRELQITDFCVLCPNCHRMIHRLENADDIELLSEIVKSNK